MIKSLNNTSPCHDKLPPIVAKACMDRFIEPITYLINESLKSEVFPSELKHARVVPIVKSGDPNFLTNYRPGLGSSTVDQVLKYFKYTKYIPSTSTGQVLIYLKST